MAKAAPWREKSRLGRDREVERVSFTPKNGGGQKELSRRKHALMVRFKSLQENLKRFGFTLYMTYPKIRRVKGEEPARKKIGKNESRRLIGAKSLKMNQSQLLITSLATW